MSERPVRYCDVCKQYDDHPRHTSGNPLTDDWHIRHMDCCAAEGCVVCQETEVENEGRRGEALIDHLESVREG